MAADFYPNPSYFQTCNVHTKFQFIWLLFLQKLFSHVFL